MAVGHYPTSLASTSAGPLKISLMNPRVATELNTFGDRKCLVIAPSVFLVWSFIENRWPKDRAAAFRLNRQVEMWEIGPSSLLYCVQIKVKR